MQTKLNIPSIKVEQTVQKYSKQPRPKKYLRKLKPLKKRKQTYKCLLITNIHGQICFATGKRLLEFSHYEILGKNFFKDLVTPYSLIQTSRNFKGQILPPNKDSVSFACEVRTRIKDQNQSFFKEESVKKVVQKVYKRIKVMCSRIYAKFNVGKVEQRKIEVEQLKNQSQISQMEELIVLQIEDFGLPYYFDFYTKDSLIQSLMKFKGNKVASTRQIKVCQNYKKVKNKSNNNNQIQLIYEDEAEYQLSQ